MPFGTREPGIFISHVSQTKSGKRNPKSELQRGGDGVSINWGQTFQIRAIDVPQLAVANELHN